MQIVIKSVKGPASTIQIRGIGADAVVAIQELLRGVEDLDEKGKLRAFNSVKSDMVRQWVEAMHATEITEDFRKLFQFTWNVLCSVGHAKGCKVPSKNGDNYELPTVHTTKRKDTRAAVPVVKKFDAPHGDDYGRWKSLIDGFIQTIRKFEANRTHETERSLNEYEWGEVIDSVWLLGVQDPYYSNFFKKLHKIVITYMSHEDFAIDVTRMRIRSNLRRLVPSPKKGRSQPSILDYKGACAEILDAFNTIRFRSGVTRIVTPRPNSRKAFDTEDLPKGYHGAKIDKQDVDRIEVYFGDIKLYIEVKADAQTAVNKHSKLNPAQLLRYMAVVKTRMKKGISSCNESVVEQKVRFEERVVAVSISNPKGWLELFTSGTVRNYFRNNIWLIIDGLLIPPIDLAMLDRKIWTDFFPDESYPEKLTPSHHEKLGKIFNQNQQPKRRIGDYLKG
jgi:hypothetical protein